MPEGFDLSITGVNDRAHNHPSPGYDTFYTYQMTMSLRFPDPKLI